MSVRDFFARLRKTPHLFAKATVAYCIACATAACAWCLLRQGEGREMEGVLAVALGFFGGELMLLCLKTILKREGKERENSSDEPGV